MMEEDKLFKNQGTILICGHGCVSFLCGGNINVPESMIIPEKPDYVNYDGETTINVSVEQLQEYCKAYEEWIGVIEPEFVFENYTLKMDDIVLISFNEYKKELYSYKNMINNNYKSPIRKTTFNRRGHRQSYKPPALNTYIN